MSYEHWNIEQELMNNKHLKEFQIEVYLNLINCPAHDQFVSIILI